MKEHVLTLHGIATAGEWQDQVASAFAPHFTCVTMRYPQYRRLGAFKLLQEPWILVPGILVWLATDPGTPLHSIWFLLGVVVAAYAASYHRRTRAFNRMLEQGGPYATRAQQANTHIIAHSFGTYLTGRALLKRPDYCAGRLVLVGCVLPRAFEWQKLVGNETDLKAKCHEVRNELAGRDLVVYLAWLMSPFIKGLGMAGYRGFRGASVHDVTGPDSTCGACTTALARVHNVRSEHLGHSDTFVTSVYAETYWLPYLWGIDPVEYQHFLQYCRAAAGLERQWSQPARNAGHVDPRLLLIEQRLRAQGWRWTGGTFGAFVEQEVMSRFPGDAAKLQESVSLAIRGTWDSVRQGLDAHQERTARAVHGIAPFEKADAAIGWLNPHRAVRKAVAELPD